MCVCVCVCVCVCEPGCVCMCMCMRPCNVGTVWGSWDYLEWQCGDSVEVLGPLRMAVWGQCGGPGNL